MRLAVSNIGWTDAEDAEIAPRLRDAGVEAIEVAPGRVFADPPAAREDDARAVAQHWARQGLPVVSMQALLFGRPELRLLGDAGAQEEHEAYLAHVIGLAGALGCGPLVYGSPKNRLKGEMDDAAARDAAVPALRRLGDIAVAAGCTFCLEANARAYGCDFMTRLADAADIAAAVAHPGVAVVADTGNMMMEEEPPEAVDAVASRVAHLHVSAPNLGPVHPHAAYVGSVIDRLAARGYDGTVTIEMRPGEGPAPLENLLRGLSMVRDMLERQ